MQLARTEMTQEALYKKAPSAFAGQPWSGVSDKYVFLPTSDVISGLREAGFVPVEAQQSLSRIPGKEFFTKHMIRFQALEQLNQPAVVGASVLEAILINSHDRSSAYKLFLGLFRFVCANGMVVGDLFDSINVRHTGNIIDDVIRGIRRIFSQSATLLDTVAAWEKLEMSPEAQLAFAQAAHGMRFPVNPEPDAPKVYVTPEMLLRPNRSEDEGNSLWLTYNRVQENLTQGISARAVRNLSHDSQARGARAIRGIDRNVKVNGSLWNLASTYAEKLAA